jgi:FtsP/CotA-like multicopper oxidase with cupredoxin domain
MPFSPLIPAPCAASRSMIHLCRAAGALCGFLSFLGPSTALSQSPNFDPRSTSEAPCGIGTPPPGHEIPELTPSAEGVTLTVRQDGNRLCYVAEGNADAPVIRARLGSELIVTLRNEISDPAAIDSVSGPGKLTSANEAVPSSGEYYPVVPGRKHEATGATNLHVHGFAVPPVRPEDEVLMTCTDPAVGPARCGQRAFTYHYHIPPDMPEGLYWYHPHVHGEVQAQMLMGLSGAIIVEGPQEDARRKAGIEERVLVVRQTQDVDAGKPQGAAMTAAPSSESGATDRNNGRKPPNAIDTEHELLCTRNSGIDAISLNGTPIPLGDAPDSAYAHWQIPENGMQFWRILNAATDAFLSLSLVDDKGTPLPMQVVAVDGSPLTDDAGALLPLADTLEPQFVPPSGRLEVMVKAPSAGIRAYLVTHSVDTGCAGDRLPERRLAIIDASPAAGAPGAGASSESASGAGRATAGAPKPGSALERAPSPRATPEGVPVAAIRARSLYDGLLARKTAHRRVIALAEYPRPGTDDQIDFYIAERRPGAVLKPYEMGDPPAITVQAGTTEEWTVENWTNELHAFHIHQVHFRVLAIDGERVKNSPLLDVVNVPYATATGYHSKEGPIRPGRVLVKLSFPARLAGDIPFHCHLVDHEDNGMMAVLRVLKPAGSSRGNATAH